LTKLQKELQYKEINNIDIRMIDFPITLSDIIIDPINKGNNYHLECIEPFIFSKIKEKEKENKQQQKQIIYKLNPISVNQKNINNSDKINNILLYLILNIQTLLIYRNQQHLLIVKTGPIRVQKKFLIHRDFFFLF